MGLDKDFPSTVNAIVRTIGKVSPKTDLPLGRCRLCQRSVQRHFLLNSVRQLSGAILIDLRFCFRRATPFVVEEWNARTAIRSLSHTSSAPHIDSRNDKDVPSDLCYVCHTAFTSRGSKSTTPVATKGGEGGAGPMPVWAMRGKISEFLLDEDD